MTMAIYDDDGEDNSEELEWLKQKQIAALRREKIKPLTIAEHDEVRKAQMLKDQAMVKAAQIKPGDMTGNADPFAIDTNISLPLEADIVSVPLPKDNNQINTVFADIIFWACTFDSHPEDHKKAPVGPLYSQSWRDLKTILKGYPNGSATATEFKFKNSPVNILGFFCPDQYAKPTMLSENNFMIIIQDGKVFKEEA